MKTKLTKLFAAMLLASASAGAFAQTRANVAHLAPFAPGGGTAVSVNVNAAEALTGVTFNQVSGYLALSGPGVAPGNTTLEVFAPPGTPPAAISAVVNLAADTDYTVVAIGNVTNQPLALLPLVDNNTPPAAGNVKLRIAHTAPFAAALPDTAVSIRTESGDIVNGLASVQYGQDSGYFEVPAGTYDLKISTPDGVTTLINPAAVPLPAGAIVTVFAVGDGVNQPLGITAVFGDGTSAILPLEQAGGGPTDAVALPSMNWIGLALLAIALAFVAFRRRPGQI
ncbi:MAG: DUF4397 domain-containing protein [Dokdonella sp.]